MFTKEDFEIPKLTSPLSQQMPEISIDIEGVKPLMRNLDPYKANFPNKLRSLFLKLMAEERSAGLTLIFRASFHPAEVSNAWHDVVSPSINQDRTTEAIHKNIDQYH